MPMLYNLKQNKNVRLINMYAFSVISEILSYCPQIRTKAFILRQQSKSCFSDPPIFLFLSFFTLFFTVFSCAHGS